MKIQFGSDAKSVHVTVTASQLSAAASPTTGHYLDVSARKVAVAVPSTTGHVSLSIKPSVIAQEQRQERLNRSIKLGFSPVSKSTKG